MLMTDNGASPYPRVYGLDMPPGDPMPLYIVPAPTARPLYIFRWELIGSPAADAAKVSAVYDREQDLWRDSQLSVMAVPQEVRQRLSDYYRDDPTRGTCCVTD